MQLDLTDDQSLFHQTTLRFIEAELPLSQTRSLHDDPQGFTRSWLRQSAEIGWFAMLVPESYGGGSVSGAGLLDALIVSEELGRNMQPGPFIPMNIVASALASGGSGAMRSAVLPKIVAGEEVATWAVADDCGNWDEGSGVALERSGSNLRLTGTRGFVQDAVSADWLLVVATSNEGPVQALVRTDDPRVDVRPLTGLDLSRRLADVIFDGVEVSPDALLDTTGLDALDAQLLLAAVLVCADTVGAIDALLAMTVAYAKDRIAFGRPIGSFQAVKHVLADQALYLETCRAGAVAAAKAVETGAGNASEIVSMVAAYIGDVSNELAQECLQVHGGIGYTWEHDLHLFLRRVRSNAVLYGEPTWHRERVFAFHDRNAGALR
jgi:alkylation response protein AidB-like acyl-CoA dehydrogenase